MQARPFAPWSLWSRVYEHRVSEARIIWDEKGYGTVGGQKGPPEMPSSKSLEAVGAVGYPADWTSQSCC